MKRRSDSVFGLHFDFHATPGEGKAPIGSTLREEDIRTICRTLRPDFLQIDCKGHPGWASYPTECGNAMPEFAGDPLALWRRITREEGVALYMHYSGVYDMKYCAEHPEQAVMKADGTRSGGSTRTMGRYVEELVIPQMLELAGKYGLDGIWVDGDCWASQPDFDPETVAAFEQETGIDLEGKLPAQREDRYFEEYREFCRELFRRYVRKYVDAVHAQYPHFQIASNWAYTDHMPEPISSNVDFLSGDFTPHCSFDSARYAGRAIAQQNYTWDLMAWNWRIGRSDGVKTPANIAKHPVQIMQEAAALMALGGGFQNYIPQYSDGSPRMDEILRMESVAEFVREREPFCFRGRAIHQAALLLSTWDRHRESESLFSRTGYEKVWGLNSLLCDAGHSVEIVSEHTLSGHCADYPVIIIPELFEGLATETIRELLDYAAAGGSLVLSGVNTCRVFAEAGAPMQAVEIRPQGLITLDGLEFAGVLEHAVLDGKGEVLAQVCRNPRGEKAPMAALYPWGKGKIAAIGLNMGTAYVQYSQNFHSELIKTVLDKMYDPMVRLVNAEGIVEIVCLQKDGHRMIQLVNANGQHRNPGVCSESRIQPCRDVQLKIRLDKKPEKLILQPEGALLPFVYDGEGAMVTVDRLKIHEIIQIVE